MSNSRPVKRQSPGAKTKKDLKLVVKNNSELMSFLSQALHGKSRTGIKFLLKEKMILVDGKQVSQFNHPLKTGQIVIILAEKPVKEKPLTGLKIIYEDDVLLVVNKFSGMLSSPSPKERQKTAFSIITGHVRKESSKAAVYLINSLDRETSGLLLFAKNEAYKLKLQQSWKELLSERLFAAWVEGEMKKSTGTISSYLRQSKALKVHSSQNVTYGDHALTSYKVIKRRKGSTFVHIQAETDVKNQIRVHMQEEGHPIIGDKKYGAKLHTMGRLALHLNKVTVIHPVSGEKMQFTAPVPSQF